MEFIVKFRCNGDVFADMPRTEVARILDDLANKIRDGYAWNGILRDYNGDIVGEYKITEDDD